MEPTIEAQLSSLRQRVEADADLSKLDLIPSAKASVRLTSSLVTDGELKLGESRVGGNPDVPPGFEWPRWMPPEPRKDLFARPWNPAAPVPLGFIAQIDLSAAPAVNDRLPRSGWLYFFYDRYCETWGYDPADCGTCRVIYFGGDRSQLSPQEPPADLNREHIAKPSRLEGVAELTLREEWFGGEFEEAAWEKYHNLCEELTGAAGPVQHRLLGNPQIVQNPMEFECQLVSNGVFCGTPDGYKGDRAESLRPGAADWMLLLQIDSDEEGPGWMWGDSGRIYYWIRKQDLAALRFDDVWLILQCF